VDILNNLYIFAVKNKHFVPTGLLLLINSVVKNDNKRDVRDNFKYLGDNVPLRIVGRIRELALSDKGKSA